MNPAPTFPLYFSKIHFNIILPLCLGLSSILKHLKIKIYETKFAYCFVWVWNLVSHIEGRIQIGGWVRTGSWGEYLDLSGSDMILEKTAYCGASQLLRLTKCWQGDQTNKDEMGWLCSIHAGSGNIYKICLEHLKEETTGSVHGWEDIWVEIKEIGW